ncbi:MAG: carboxy terminal-processing peptidase [Saprospiraceae bacterium]|nr:carboxy terminal-processing peptidase [Saprospiraceae bacterium]
MRVLLAVAAMTLGGVFFNGNVPDVTKDDKDKEKMIILAVLRLIEGRHFETKQIDDDFSRKVFKTYMKRLDGGKRFLTIGDFDLMDDYEQEIDDAINDPNGPDLEFFDLSYELINNAIEKVRGIYPRILDQPFDFSIDEDIELDGDKIDYAPDDAALEQRWRSYLKYETLTRLADKLDDQEKAEDPEGGKKSISELEAEAREDVREMMDEWFQRLSEVRRSDRFETFLNAITNTFDPHTDYFNPKAKEDFNINMSRRLEGIGARLQRDGDYTKVVSIVPGGPAWKQGDLQVDDVIYTVKQDGEEPVDIQGMHIDDVVSMIRGKKGTFVTLTVRNVDGDMLDVRIKRDEVRLEDGFAKSAIIEHPDKVNKVGYIQLPKFYADFENPDGNSCAEDVAKEIKKLKKQNIEGLILDLRNNGGGSLNDVVEMSGLFIKDGPIVQVKARHGDPYVFRDKDPDVLYTGPLVIMVNSFSASASEILAAALQDYGRAIIVGSNSTFGKGTVQRFYDLDRALRGIPADLKPLGELKMTMQKFYRINGGSTQLKGVIPDVILPDRYTYIESGEKQLDAPMPWTEIAPVEYKQDILDLSRLDVLQKKSKARIKTNETFGKIDENAQRVKRIRDMSEYSLQLEEYRSLMKARDEEAKRYRNLFQPIEGMQVLNLPEDLTYIRMDSSRIDRNDAWLEGLNKDVYLDETLSIMRDMIVEGVALYEKRSQP